MRPLKLLHYSDRPKYEESWRLRRLLCKTTSQRWCEELSNNNNNNNNNSTRDEQMLTNAHVPEWMTKGNITLIQKVPRKRTAPNNYRPVTWMSQRIQRHSRINLHRSTHPKWEQDQTEKWPGLTTRRHMICPHKAGYYTVSKCTKYHMKS